MTTPPKPATAVRRFSIQSTKYERALQIWQILTAHAHNRRTITYHTLAEILDYNSVPFVGRFLDPIDSYREQNGLPPLAVVAVNRDTGEPSRGYIGVSMLNKNRERVFAHEWFNIYPPTPADLQTAHQP